MKDIYRNIEKNKNSLWFSIPALTGYYLLSRLVFGISDTIIYLFAIILVLIRIPFGYLAMVFFLITIITYLFGTFAEANHYLSFVFGFIVLNMLSFFYNEIRKKYFKTS